MRRMTYDILDAGPRSRFTVNGRVVHNCTGEDPQPTNSPKAGPDLVRCGCKRHYSPALQACPWCGLPRDPTDRVVEWSPKAAEDAIEVLRQRSLQVMEHVFGDALHAIAGCIRGLYDAAPGHDLISTDYNSIEAVGLAMLSGEQWRIDVFRTHGKIYEASASTMFKVPFEEFERHKKETGQHHPLRQKGKVAELACLAGDTLVLTCRGYVPLLDVRPDDQLWDGVEWVSHAGLVARGKRQVIDLAGVRMTSDHRVHCGDSWRAASRLASNASTLSLALATGSANLPLNADSAGIEFWSAAPAALGRTSFCSRTFGSAARLGATLARIAKRGRRCGSTSPTPTWWPTTGSVVGSWAASAQPSAGATTPATPGMKTTAHGASSSHRSGGRTSGDSSNTWARWWGGMTRAWTWTVETLTALTHRAKFDLSLAESTHETSDASPN
jgi:ribosomal protein L37E